MHLAGFIIEIYYDARSYRSQIGLWYICRSEIAQLLNALRRSFLNILYAERL